MKNKENRKFLETARRTARRVCGANKRKGLLCFALLSTSLFYCDGSRNGSGGPGDPAPPPLAISSLDMGSSYACALLNNGTIKCWGANNAGQLGLGLNKKYSIGDEPMEMGSNLPALDLGNGRAVRALRVGGNSSCAILDNDELKCWGRNNDGDLGLGDTNIRGDNPNEMGDNLPAVNLGSGRAARVLVASSTHHCAILDNDELKCWGANNLGQLGLGDTNDRGDGLDEMGDALADPLTEMGDNLLAVDLGMGRTVKMLAAGTGHTCAILDNDSLKCWGVNTSGQLGLGDDDPRGVNEVVSDLLAVDLGMGRTARMIFAGGNHTCAILDDDSLKCWGGNSSGQLGLGDTNDRRDGIADMGEPDGMGDMLPAIDLGSGRTARMLAIGSAHTCAILDNDELKCWGANNLGQLGLGDTNDRGVTNPNEVAMLPAIDLGSGRTARMIFAGGSSTCAILDNDELKCWGSNYGPAGSGQLGQGDMGHRGDEPDEMGDNLLPIELF